jgi:tetratricopeptide (TPR) repeat protein
MTSRELIKLANQCKLEDRLEEAGDLLMEAAKKMEEPPDHTTRTTFRDAARCYRDINSIKAVDAFNKAIDIANSEGRFCWSAFCTENLAEVFFYHGYKQEALDEYKKACHLFNISDCKAYGKNSLLKASIIMAELEQSTEVSKAYVIMAELEQSTEVAKAYVSPQPVEEETVPQSGIIIATSPVKRTWGMRLFRRPKS